MKPINFIPSEVAKAKLMDIKERRGIKTITEAICWCILEAYKTEVKDYIEVQKQRNSVPPEERAIRKARAGIIAEEERTQAKEDKRIGHLAGICDILGGTRVDNPTTGVPLMGCKYTEYDFAGPWVPTAYSKVVDLEDLNDETPSLQYRGILGETGEAGKASYEKYAKRALDTNGTMPKIN